VQRKIIKIVEVIIRLLCGRGNPKVLRVASS
jgi:hypothetical protein